MAIVEILQNTLHAVYDHRKFVVYVSGRSSGDHVSTIYSHNSLHDQIVLQEAPPRSRTNY
jgi:hypothetical protein